MADEGYVWCGAHSLKLPCLWCKTFAEIEALKRGGGMDQDEYQLWERRQKVFERIADAAESMAGALMKIARPMHAVMTDANAVNAPERIPFLTPGAPR